MLVNVAGSSCPSVEITESSNPTIEITDSSNPSVDISHSSNLSIDVKKCVNPSINVTNSFKVPKLSNTLLIHQLMNLIYPSVKSVNALISHIPWTHCLILIQRVVARSCQMIMSWEE